MNSCLKRTDISYITASKACEICGGYSCQSYDNPGKLPHAIVRCRECGLVYSDVLLLPVEYAHTIAKDPLVARDAGLLKDREALRIDNVLSEIVSFRKKGRLLDVGCGHGFLVMKARERGYETYGVEIMSSSAAYGIKAGLNIQIGEVVSAKFSDEFFDVIVMSQVLEHMMYPKRNLKEAHKILKKDGIIYIVVPNVESRNAKKCSDWWSEYHLYHFSVLALKKLVEAAGFVPLKDIINPHVPPQLKLLRRYLYAWGVAKVVRRFLTSFLGTRIRGIIPAGSITMVCRKA